MPAAVLGQGRVAVPAAGQDRSWPLDGLRGVAAALVFAVHYCSLMQPWVAGSGTGALADAAGLLGNAGVELFFTLSGYLIYGSLMRGPWSLGPYLLRRAQRLYPAFLAVLLVYVVLSAALPEQSRIPSEPAAAGWLILQNALLLPGVFPVTPIVTVAWTLSYEAAFYLLAPLLVSGLRLRAWPRPTRAVLILLLAGASQLLPMPHARVGLFACGMLLVEALPLVWRLPPLDALAACAVIGCGALLLASPPDSVGFAALFCTCFLLGGSALPGRGPLARLLATPPFVWFGTMSYSYYLLHGLVLKGMAYLLAAAWPPGGQEPAVFWVMLPVAGAATVGAALVLFRLVEQPFSLAYRVQTRR